MIVGIVAAQATSEVYFSPTIGGSGPSFMYSNWWLF